MGSRHHTRTSIGPWHEPLLSYPSLGTPLSPACFPRCPRSALHTWLLHFLLLSASPGTVHLHHPYPASHLSVIRPPPLPVLHKLTCCTLPTAVYGPKAPPVHPTLHPDPASLASLHCTPSTVEASSSGSTQGRGLVSSTVLGALTPQGPCHPLPLVFGCLSSVFLPFVLILLALPTYNSYQVRRPLPISTAFCTWDLIPLSLKTTSNLPSQLHLLVALPLPYQERQG